MYQDFEITDGMLVTVTEEVWADVGASGALKPFPVVYRPGTTLTAVHCLGGQTFCRDDADRVGWFKTRLLTPHTPKPEAQGYDDDRR